jgi:hypothetical protein
MLSLKIKTIASNLKKFPLRKTIPFYPILALKIRKKELKFDKFVAFDDIFCPSY